MVKAKVSRLRYCLLFIFGITVYLTVISPFSQTVQQQPPSPDNIPADAARLSERSTSQQWKRVTVLDWTGFMGKKLPENGRDYLSACPELREYCSFTADRSKSANASALIFHHVDVLSSDLPGTRQPWQRYVFFSHEAAPSTSLPNDVPKQFFNWTMTMSSKSDIPWPYARFQARQTWAPALNQSLFEAKKKSVAWFVSNCRANSLREQYVDELKKHISVDIYGGCGNHSCPHGEECRTMVENEYKFYLTFENSVCEDYITEKYWWFANRNVILIVLSGEIMKHAGSPSDAYIAADSFASPAQLAQYLKRVGSDWNLYSKYFQWRSTHEVLRDEADPDVGICRLCETLVLESIDPGVSASKHYSDVLSWYRNVSHCDNALVPRLLVNQSST